jgi:uncharacterized cupin superfamily protein
MPPEFPTIGRHLWRDLMTPIIPVRLEADLASGKSLVPMGKWPPKMLIRGVEPSRYTTWFEGQISAMVYAPSDGALRFTGTTFDEFVIVLDGYTVLTPEGSAPQRFNKGDAFVLPQGFDGVWEFFDNYRELMVFETKALRAVMDAWKLDP